MISIDKQLISETLKKAHQSPRHRQIFRFHKVFIALKGKLAIIRFNEKGRILDHYIIDEKGPNFGVEIKPKEWHSMVALEPSVVYEVKQGPYNKKTDKVFPAWAPEENTKKGQKYLSNLKLQI